MARATKKKAGTALASKASTNVADIRAALAKQRENQASAIGVSGGAQAKIQDDLQISLPDGTVGAELSVVILDFQARKTQYDAPFGSDLGPPDCWALAEPASRAGGGTRGDIHSTLSPHTNVLEPKNPDCGTCQLNEFGTGGRSGTGKGCNDRYQLVFAAAGNPNGSLFELNVMVSAKKAWEAYVSALDAQWGMIPLQAITTISATRINESKAWQFSFEGENDLFAEYYARQTEAADTLEIGYTVATSQLPKATKKKAARRKARSAR